MNREILFRGFHEDVTGKTVITVDGVEKRSEWMYGCYCTKGYGGASFDCIEPKNDEEAYYTWKVIPQTVGQFTGLVDKNGKRIFEGDIVSDGAVMYTVEFHSSAWFKRFAKDKSAYSRLHYNANCLEIIGDIFESPDLIGGESNG